MKRIGKGFSGKETPLFPTMGRIDEIDADEDIALVSTHDYELQDEGIEDVGEEEVVEVVTTAKMLIDTIVDAAQVTTAIADILAPKRKRVMIQEPEETKTTKTAYSQQPQLQDKAEKLQAGIDEEVRLARERAQKEQEANNALINTWDDIQAKINKRIKFFTAKRDEEKRNRPPTKAQQRSIVCTYLKNMDEWKIKSLKKRSFAEIQELFDKAMKRINNFVDFITELVEESTKKDEAETTQESSSKREGDKLEQERSKKQKMEDDKESTELKQCLEIVPDDGDDVTIDATPLSSNKLLNNFDRKDVEVLWRLVKAIFDKVQPVDNMDSFLLHNLKTMFAHHVEDNVWKNQQGLTKMFNDVKLQVDYEYEMDYELLRLVKKQLKE
nr:hypothetical protein [Tanacetum cinerariifolium]